MTETLNGLLTQKPGRDPEVGAIKCYTVEKRTSDSGKDWLKVKNSTPDKGGSNYRILNVQQTDFVDAHGNVSFSIELEQVPNGQESTSSGPHSVSTGPPSGYAHPPRGEVYHPAPPTDPVKAAKAHLARAAHGMLLCLGAAQYIEITWKKESGLDLPEGQFQALTSTLYIDLQRAGLINGLPVAKPTETPEEPF